MCVCVCVLCLTFLAKLLQQRLLLDFEAGYLLSDRRVALAEHLRQRCSADFEDTT